MVPESRAKAINVLLTISLLPPPKNYSIIQILTQKYCDSERKSWFDLEAMTRNNRALLITVFMIFISKAHFTRTNAFCNFVKFKAQYLLPKLWANGANFAGG